jgi:hypothetical protein
VKGEQLQALLGTKIENLRVYSYRFGEFTPMPYQFDELNAKNLYCLPYGENPNEDKDKGLLDENDEFVFLSRDTGDKVAQELWVKGYEKAVKLEVKDPLTGEKGWLYMFSFTDNPPERSPINYVDYMPKIDAGIATPWMHQDDARRTKTT